MMEWWELFTIFDFGVGLQLVPIFLILGISYSLSRTNRDLMIIQLPLTIAAVIVFPFFSRYWIFLSISITIANIMGSKLDTITQIKSIFRSEKSIRAKKIKSVVESAKDKLEAESQLSGYLEEQIEKQIEKMKRGGK